MANNKNETRVNNSRVSSLVNIVNDRMKMLYRDTYNTDKTLSDEVDATTDTMEKNIDNIINRNGNYELSNVTKLITRTRLQSSVNDGKFKDEVENIFNDDTLTNSLLTSYIANKDIIEIDNEIDTVCRYMTKLEEALNAKADAVLSSDDYSRDFINATNAYNIGGEEKDSIFSDRMKTLKKKYKLSDRFELWYKDAQKYGEEFVYRVPYSKAISDILRRKGDTRQPGISGFRETVTLVENGNIVKDREKFKDLVTESTLISKEDKSNIKVEFMFGGILESAIADYERMLASKKTIEEATSVLNEAKTTKNIKLDKTIDDNLELPKDQYMANDGIISLNDKPKSYDVKVPGCVVRRLKRSNTIPIYIDDIFLGLYYIEFTNGTNGYEMYSNLMYDYNDYSTFGGANTSVTSKNTVNQEHRQNLLNYLSYNIANNIDDRFINNNQDLAKEIYAILRHNDVYNSPNTTEMIRVSFLAADDVTHIKFNEDPETHRGISDLAKSLIPAKLYSCLYITNTLGILTRGQDKRVYYVKQNIEQNISQTLLNVINQIKKSNFGIRQVESMNTILNITGRFNDYIIPVGPSGDSPIQFEVMQGQEFNPNTELMESLEDMAVNGTDVPIELINARLSLDFATQISMTNIKFLRHCYNRQAKCEEYFSEILTVIYNCEFGENIEIKCCLPTPTFLNTSNLQNIIENTKNTTETIAGYEYDDQDEDEQAKQKLFVKHFMQHKLSTYLKQDEIEKVKKDVEFEYSKIKTKKLELEDNQE